MSKEELAKLEKETDLAAIEYFKLLELEDIAIDTLRGHSAMENDEAFNALKIVKAKLLFAREEFQRTKIAHLKAKHGIE